MSSDFPDFVALKVRYESESFPSGARSELRRVADLDAVALCPALYRLFPGQKPDARHRRVAFLLPSCKHDTKAKLLGVQLAQGKVAEARILQVARSHAPLDLIQLRRLLIYIKPSVNWQAFGKTIWCWGEHEKHQFVEDYYLAKFTPSKGDK